MGGSPKTNEPRQVPINDDLAELFKEIRKELNGQYVFTYRKSEDKLKGTEPVRKRKKLAPVPEGSKQREISLQIGP